MIDQLQDGQLEHTNLPGIDLCYMYRRSSESRGHNAPGQDYLTFDSTENGLAFVVCDGVGQSFCGDLAAKFLGDVLVQRSASIYEEILRNGDNQQANMTSLLNELQEAGQQCVQSFSLPDDMPPMVRQALEGQREYGSETMFVYGYLEHAEANPEREPQLWLFWLGDAEVQLYSPEGEPIPIAEANWTAQERWSTTRGIRGSDQVHMWQWPADEIGRILVYSDGLAGLADRLYELVEQPHELEAQIDQASQAPKSDDISFMDIALTSAMVATAQADPESPPPVAPMISRFELTVLGICVLIFLVFLILAWAVTSH